MLTRNLNSLRVGKKKSRVGALNILEALGYLHLQ